MPQFLPSAQRLIGAQVPPQSTSDSFPFLRPSVQLVAPHAPLEQMPLVQSLLPEHPPPAAQRAQLVGPPQSTAVSPPFFTLSAQLGATRLLLAQTPLSQS